LKGLYYFCENCDKEETIHIVKKSYEKISSNELIEEKQKTENAEVTDNTEKDHAETNEARATPMPTERNEPTTNRRNSGKTPVYPQNKFKTKEICQYCNTGKCSYDRTSCQNEHPQICRYYIKYNNCRDGEHCNFGHPEICKDFQRKGCTRKKCRFFHAMPQYNEDSKYYSRKDTGRYQHQNTRPHYKNEINKSDQFHEDFLEMKNIVKFLQNFITQQRPPPQMPLPPGHFPPPGFRPLF
jgi:hypothetical protein